MTNSLSYFSELRGRRWIGRGNMLDENCFWALAAILSGASSRNEVEGYCKAKRAWLKSFLSCRCPSHESLNRLISALDPEDF